VVSRVPVLAGPEHEAGTRDAGRGIRDGIGDK